MNTVKWALEATIDLYKKADLADVNTQEDAPSTAINRIDPEFSKYMFLGETLSVLLNKDIDQRFNDEFAVFILQNKSKIDKILNTGSFSGFLGKGKDGVAMQLGSEFVLKIFLDDVAFNDAKKSLNRLYDDPSTAKTEAMMYDVGTLGTFLNRTLYYYIIEKMKTIQDQKPEVSKNLSDIVGTIIKDIQLDKKKWDLLKKYFADPSKVDRVKNLIVPEIQKTISMLERNLPDSIKFFNMNSDLQLKSTWLSSLVEEIFMKYLTDRTDIHFGNIGITNFGEFRYFDPSWGKAKSRFEAQVKNNKNIDDETLVVS